MSKIEGGGRLGLLSHLWESRDQHGKEEVEPRWSSAGSGKDSLDGGKCSRRAGQAGQAKTAGRQAWDCRRIGEVAGGLETAEG